MKSLEDRSQNKFQMKWKYKVRKSSPYSKVLSVSFGDVTEIRTGYEARPRQENPLNRFMSRFEDVGTR